MKKTFKALNDCALMTSSEIIQTILDSRGVDDINSLLCPSIEEIKGDIPLLKEGAQRFAEAIKDHKKFVLNVDSDADGVTSGTIMYKYLQAHGIEPKWHISFQKSHGTSDDLMELIAQENPDVVVIMDSLDSDSSNYKRIYNEFCKEIYVLDHHDIDYSQHYDDYVTLISSNRGNNTELTGAGVVWMFCRELDRILDVDFASNLVDLAATGIVADMGSMGLNCPENRAIVNLGLNNLQNKAIKKIVGSYDFDSTAVSFSIAPLINAGCRYGENEVSFEMFISDKPRPIGEKLKLLQQCKENQNIEIAEAMEDFSDAKVQEHKNFIFFESETKGDLKGLMANKIANSFDKPTIVVNRYATKCFGSGRGANVKNFKDICDASGLCECRGHQGAFGFNIENRNLEAFFEYLDNALPDADTEYEVTADVTCEPEDITEDLIREVTKMNRLSGKDFPAINFMISSDDFLVSTMSHGKHLVLEDRATGLKFIKWNAGELEEFFSKESDNFETYTFIGTLATGYLGNKKCNRLIINDFIKGRVL